MKEKQLKNLIRHDFVGTPNKNLEARLNYAFMLKSSKIKVRQNSFSDFFSWIFSLKSLGLKTTLATILLAFVMLKPNLNINHDQNSTLDSTQINQNLVLDSTLFHTDTKTANDSIF